MILGAVTPKNQKDLRSSLHPNTIKPILDMGINIIFESGLGAGMDVNDEVLTSLGAKSVSREACLSKSDVLMSTSPIASNEISLMKDKALFLGLMEPFSNKEQFSAFQLNNISAVSMEFIPHPPPPQFFKPEFCDFSISPRQEVLRCAVVFSIILIN